MEIIIDEKLLLKIKKLADSHDWMKREDAASEIKKINDHSFPEYLPVWEKWINDPNPNIRRAVEVGLLRIKKQWVRQALDLLEPLLSDAHVYVRRNCGPFAFSALGHKDPEYAFEKIGLLLKSENSYVLWNIAQSLGVMFGVKNPKEAFNYLRILAGNKERFVWRAAASSIVKLLRRNPERKREVFSWKGCRACLEVVRKYIN